MAAAWHKTAFSGIRYREHPSRLHDDGPDRYYTIRCKIQGREREEGVGWASEGATPEEAARKLLQLRAVLAQPKKPADAGNARRPRRSAGGPTPEDATLAWFWDTIYFPGVRKSKAEYSAGMEAGLYRNWIEPALGPLPLQRLTSERLEQVLRTVLASGRKPRTARYVLSMAAQIWSMAEMLGYVEGESPCRSIQLPTLHPPRLHILNETEVRPILAALARHAPDLHLAALLSLFCGLCSGELFRLSWADVSLGTGVIFVRGQNRHQARTVHIPSAVGKLLSRRSWEGISGMGGMSLADHVFARKQGTRREEFSKRFQRIAIQEGWPGAGTSGELRFAVLRHTFAAWLIMRGVPFDVVAGQLGHQTSTIVQRYAHLAPAPARQCLAVLEEKWLQVSAAPEEEEKDASRS